MQASDARGRGRHRRGLIRTAFAVAGTPSLWATAVRQVRRTVTPGWWRRPPFVPRPDPGYLSFRLTTQYGRNDHAPDPDDVLNYLAWCRHWDGHRVRQRHGQRDRQRYQRR